MFFYYASLAEPREMESLAVKAHIGHCCVSVGLLAVLHHLCTQDELNLNFSMLPRHSMAANRCQVLLNSCTSLSASVPPIPPLHRICPCLSFCVTCVLMSSRSVSSSCGCVQSCSDCLPLLPAAQIRAGTLVARSTRPNVVNIGPSTPSLSSPFGASHRCCKFVASAAPLP